MERMEDKPLKRLQRERQLSHQRKKPGAGPRPYNRLWIG
jgi:hypothetical protein